MPGHYNEEEKKEESGIYPRNGKAENMEDLPKTQKVERHDGLPTVDDIREMMEGKRPSKEQELGNFIELIIKIGK
jgi:hypothetical protein